MGYYPSISAVSEFLLPSAAVPKLYGEEYKKISKMSRKFYKEEFLGW
jgi:hypothetical protein